MSSTKNPGTIHPAPPLLPDEDFVFGAVDHILPPSKVAFQLGLSTKTLANMREDGSGPPYVRVGARKLGYRASDLERYLAERTFRHTAEEVTR